MLKPHEHSPALRASDPKAPSSEMSASSLFDAPTRIAIITALLAVAFFSFTPNITLIGAILPATVLFVWIRHHVQSREAMPRCVICGSPVRPRS